MLVLTLIAVAASAVSDDSARAQELIEQLLDDRVRWNAHEAMSELLDLGARASSPLERALDSADQQQRHMAAAMLMEVPDHSPSDRMLEVCVEGLRHDQLPSDGANYNYVFNAANGVRFLTRHTPAARTHLVAALSSDDPQQQFLAAALLAYSGDEATCRLCARILLPRLRDNHVSCDAGIAAIAMRRIAHCCVSDLHAAKPAADPQQAAILELLIACATDQPPERIAELNAALPDLGMYVSDPTAFPLENMSICWSAPDWDVVALQNELTAPEASPPPSDPRPSP